MKLDENYIIINNENIDNRLEKNTEILNNILLKIFLLILFYLIINFSFIRYINIKYRSRLIKNKNITQYKYNNSGFSNKYFLPKYLNNSEYFKIIFFEYYYSLKFNIIKINYRIQFYDNNHNIIPPSELLNNNIHVICYIKAKINIDSLANIIKNQYFDCIEFFNINENIKFGIKIYSIEDNIQYFIVNLYNDNIFNFNYFFYENDEIFDPLVINKKYISMIRNINNIKINENLKLKKSYLQCPYNTLKINAIIPYNKWKFKNIYNYYFCFCKGDNCLDTSVTQKCKLNFYLYIIDNNKKIYEKTDYLFIDFIFEKFPSDDTYPVFKEMFLQNYPVHYLTEKLDIYNEYCNNEINCFTIIRINRNNFINCGDIVESYLKLFLKLKVVVSAKRLSFISNIFYDIDYITYIFSGNGLFFFKPFLYYDIKFNEKKKFDKLLLPPSNKIISIARKIGWKDEDIIKINLPRWEKYNNEFILKNKKMIENNNIFMFFGWRHVKKNKLISIFYFKNINNLLKNDLLNKEIEKNNKTLCFSIYHTYVNKYINQFKKILKKNKYIQFIEKDEIYEYIKKTSLFVTDFSSIIFDIIYRKKPFIIYIPDGNDPQIKDIYENEYYDLIQSLKNGTIIFENIFNDIHQAINKIIYYINNNFILEKTLEDFYNSFDFTNESGITKLIEYLKNLK